MFRPLHDYILVLPIKRKQSDTLEVISHEKHGRGVVVAVGPGEWRKRVKMLNPTTRQTTYTGKRVEMSLKPGDFIIYGDGTLDYMYPKYHENDIEYRILQQKDVCGIVDREEVDPDWSVTDMQIATLIAAHNPTWAGFEQTMEILQRNKNKSKVANSQHFAD